MKKRVKKFQIKILKGFDSYLQRGHLSLRSLIQSIQETRCPHF
jgi:hypothetical protein